LEILGTLIKQALTFRKNIRKVRRKSSAAKQQRKTLLKLLTKARYTQFGKQFEFDSILLASNPEKIFQKLVPIYDYDKIFKDWWYKAVQDESDVCWPGKIKYFALSSGTSGAPSKQIPVTSSMLRSMRKTSIRQVLSLTNYGFQEEFFQKGVMIVGGSSDLENRGHYYQGDLSGINATKMPFWTSPFYKPGKEIVKLRDWNAKIEEIVNHAPEWDISMITGVPAWNQIILEKIIERYKLNNIHEMWPNLQVFIYGGVAISPYLKSFEKLFGKKVHYLETYLASEGFIAYQSRKDIKGMELLLDNGIFMEFIPFNESNFNSDGTLKDNPEVKLIDEVQEETEYALLISTNAGSWRYMIGDTIKFTSLEHNEIVITGRTKHFLSLCGEHLSVDNMTEAMHQLSTDLNLPITEFTVSGTVNGSNFGHHWFLGIDNCTKTEVELAIKLDQYLKDLNDDYAVERRHALQNIRLQVIPTHKFYDWMEKNGKLGSQNKFPRVLQNQNYKDWLSFLED
jgi:GH3 auxin-responsive promoter